MGGGSPRTERGPCHLDQPNGLPLRPGVVPGGPGGGPKDTRDGGTLADRREHARLRGGQLRRRGPGHGGLGRGDRGIAGVLPRRPGERRARSQLQPARPAPPGPRRRRRSHGLCRGVARQTGDDAGRTQFFTGFAQLDCELALLQSQPDVVLDLVRGASDGQLGSVWPAYAWPLLDVAARSVPARGPHAPEWLDTAVEAQRHRGPSPPYWPPVLLARLDRSLDGWDAALEATAKPDAAEMVRMQVRLSAAEAIAGAGDRRRAGPLSDRWSRRPASSTPPVS